MKGEWTPGPWAVSGVRTKLGGEPVLTVYSEAPGPMQNKTHALVMYGDGSTTQHVQAHADARLIAAVPDQDAALNYVADMTYCGEDAEWHFKPGYDPQVVLDALAKARGGG